VKPYENSLEHLEGELLLLDLSLHRQVLVWRSWHHPDAAGDELLGLFISDREIDALLGGLYSSRRTGSANLGEATAEISGLIVETASRHDRRTSSAVAEGIELRLVTLADRLGLSPLEIGVVMLALSPEIDRRYGRIFGYLNDDASLRGPTVDLVLDLYCGNLAERAWARRVFEASGTLCGSRVVHLAPRSSGAPLLDAVIEIDPAVAGFLLGSDSMDEHLHGVATVVQGGAEPPVVDESTLADVEAAARLFGAKQCPVIHLVGSDLSDCRRVAVFLAAGLSTRRDLLTLDLAEIGDGATAADLTARAIRDCRLHQRGLALELGDGDGPLAAALDCLALAGTGLVRLIITTSDEAPRRLEAQTAVHRVVVPVPTVPARRRLWQANLDGLADGDDLTEVADRFSLTGGQIAMAAERARAGAAARGAARVDRSDLFASCRRQAGRPAAELVDRVESIHDWDDLVLPPTHKAQLQALENWVRFRPLVYDEWGFAKRVMLGRGLTVLFTGPSGTGKTMAAGILARHLGLEMYRVDLSTVVSKYIGETEKNLGGVFAAAESSNAVLFFDEADALFGKRSDVKDSHDRYANIEVSYLLQRTEAFDGVAILATNFGDNLDAAFARRVQVTIEFPFPTITDRRRIWSALFADDVPMGGDIDIDFLARQFPLTGGHIKNCALAAAFTAAADGGPVGMVHLVRAVAHELEKARQPVSATTFGAFAPLLLDVIPEGRP
jgi:hypothetical protein